MGYVSVLSILALPAEYACYEMHNHLYEHCFLSLLTMLVFTVDTLFPTSSRTYDQDLYDF